MYEVKISLKAFTSRGLSFLACESSRNLTFVVSIFFLFNCTIKKIRERGEWSSDREYVWANKAGNETVWKGWNHYLYVFSMER